MKPAQKRRSDPVHRYRGSRPWSVVGLALAATTGAVLLTGAVSTSLPEPGPEYGDRLRQFSRQVTDAAQDSMAAARAPAPEWAVQVGTFRRLDAAEGHLRALTADMPQLASLTPVLEPVGSLTRARVAGLPDPDSAGRLCALVWQHGSDCMIVPPGG